MNKPDLRVRATTKLIAGVMLLASYGVADALPPVTTTSAPAASTPKGLIRLSFPDNVEVKVLVDYVSQRLGINILLDESVASKSVTIKAPAAIPEDSLLDLLDSALRMKGLMLVDAGQRGWKKVVAVTDLTDVTEVHTDTQPANRPASAVTQVFQLQYVQPATVIQIIKPFLSKPGGNCFEIPSQNMVAVTDYASNLPRVSQLIEMMDVAGPQMQVQFVDLKYLDAAQAVSDLTRLLSEQSRTSSGDKSSRTPAINISSDNRTNRLVLIGRSEGIAAALELLKKLDVATESETKVYQFTGIAPDRVDKLARELIDPVILKNQYRSSVDRDGGLLIVTAPPEVQAEIEKLKADMDKLPQARSSPIHVYKLMNASAADVLATIQNLVGGKSGQNGQNSQNSSMPGYGFFGGGEGRGILQQAGLGNGQSIAPYSPNTFSSLNAPLSPSPSFAGGSGIEGVPQPTSQPSGGQGVGSVVTQDATVTADVNTNSIIVMASPEVQDTYEQFIKMLDKRRPQVLIEVNIVTLDTSNGYSVGVDMARKITFGDDGQALLFSSFGLSKIDTATGNLAINPGTGFNGVILAPDVVNSVIQALVTDGHSKVLSSPRILVNDNASGTLTSVSEAPFTSVNASQTVATTSFAGYASAGTTITVTPHISEGEHLNLKYTVTLNSFTGQGSSTSPPPRQTDSLDSEITIPDGYTVVVGGLTREDNSFSASRTPLLGQIPLLEYAFSSRTQDKHKSTLFVFIRPVVLRDDQFEDLKYLSDRDLARACLPEQFPKSTPVLVD